MIDKNQYNKIIIVLSILTIFMLVLLSLTIASGLSINISSGYSMEPTFSGDSHCVHYGFEEENYEKGDIVAFTTFDNSEKVGKYDILLKDDYLVFYSEIESEQYIFDKDELASEKMYNNSEKYGQVEQVSKFTNLEHENGILHRIVDTIKIDNKQYYILQGDNNPKKDTYLVSEEMIQNKIKNTINC